ncbi:MAG: branched-chain amino acid ABC transporter permease, partial [Desulfobacterales bacterium]
MVFYQIKKREQPLRIGRSALVLVLALIFSFALCALLLFFGGTPPVAGIRALFTGAFGSRWALEDTVVKAIPIFLCSLGVAAAFRLRIWNIGAEGQFALGAIGATWAALSFSQLPAWLLQPLMIAAATVCGGLWGLIPALLRQKMRANEIIVTLMLNYIAVLLLQFLVYNVWRDNVWRDPASYGFAVSPAFTEAAIIGTIADTSIHWGIVHCLLLGLLFWFFFRFTRVGFEIKVAGENVNAARYARIPYSFLVFFIMVISGALAGWAGFVEASATVNRLQPSIMVGYGYTAIVVAWLARLN